MGVAERVKWAREIAQMSQRGLAKAAGLSEAVVRHVEAGTTKTIEATTAIELARVLRCSVGWLLAGEGDPPSEESLIALREPAEGAA